MFLAEPADETRVRIIQMMRLDVGIGADVARLAQKFSTTNQRVGVAPAVRFDPLCFGELRMCRAMVAHVLRMTTGTVAILSPVALRIGLAVRAEFFFGWLFHTT